MVLFTCLPFLPYVSKQPDQNCIVCSWYSSIDAAQGGAHVASFSEVPLRTHMHT